MDFPSLSLSLSSLLKMVAAMAAAVAAAMAMAAAAAMAAAVAAAMAKAETQLQRGQSLSTLRILSLAHTFCFSKLALLRTSSCLQSMVAKEWMSPASLSSLKPIGKTQNGSSMKKLIKGSASSQTLNHQQTHGSRLNSITKVQAHITSTSS